MHYVGAPQITVVNPALREQSPRNPLFQIRTSDAGPPSSAEASDPKTYTPGELVTLHLRVTKRFTESRRATSGVAGMFACWPGLGMVGEGVTQMCSFSTDCCAVDTANFLNEPKGPGKCYQRAANCMKPHPWAPQLVGREIQAWETAKFMGLLMYAEDETGQKVGEWEIVPETPQDYWTPLDPGCDGKALMHANAALKRFHSVFHWRAPRTPQGLGKTVAFRILIKHGYTNGGAFFWPLAPAMAGGMVSKYDLALTEGEPRGSKPGWFVSERGGSSCRDVCAANGNRQCDEALLRSEGSDPFTLQAAIHSTLGCKLPILSSCISGAPALASSGLGTCWFYDDKSGRCNASTTPPAMCNSASASDMRRICPCQAAGRRRRRRLDDGIASAHQASSGEAGAENAAAARSVAPSAVLGLASLLLVSSGSEYRGTALTLSLVWGVATLLPTASAHNWMQKPASRCSKLATTNLACPAKKGRSPHVQLNPGDTFPVEWRVAHPNQGPARFIFLRAEDEEKIVLITHESTDKYLRLAPSTSAMEKSGVYCGEYKRAASCSTCKSGGCYGECALANGVCALDPTNSYRNENPPYAEGRYMDNDGFQKRFAATTGSDCIKKQGGDQGSEHGPELGKTDPRRIRRPITYNCNLGSLMKTSIRKERSARKTCHECGMKQWAYFPDKLKKDERTGYNSSEYPYIISVAKYALYNKVRPQSLLPCGSGGAVALAKTSPALHIALLSLPPSLRAPFLLKSTSPCLRHLQKGRFDDSFALANVQIPPSLGPGNYIMKYLWGKYADCVDIAVLPPKPNGDPAISAPLHSEEGDYARHAWIDVKASSYEWLRTDHCQYVRRTLGTKADGETLASSAAKVQTTYAKVPLDETTGLMQSSQTNEEKITLQAACIAIPPPGKLSSLNFDDQKALELCQARATKVKAQGINVVPMNPPPGVTLSDDDPNRPSVYYNGDPASANVASGLNIPWGIGNCKRKYFANEPPGTKICYPLVIYGNRLNAEQEQQIELSDTDDEVWYSTCYERSFKRAFSVECGGQCKPSVAKAWRFGDSCISCADAIRNSDFRVVPHWKLADPASCRACWAPISAAPPAALPPANQPENGWASPDGSLSITYTRTTGSTTAITFVVTCTICTADSGWLAMGPSPNSGMTGTHAVRWRFAEADGVDEVRITAKSTSGVTVVTPGNLNGVETTADSGKAKTLTFSTSRIGEHDIPLSGNQNWAWAFSTGAGFTQHVTGDMGVAALSFTFPTLPPVPAPTAPPIFDPSEGRVNENEPHPDPTFAPTLAPSLLPPDVNRPRIEAAVTLHGCAVTSFTDGSALWKSFVAVLAAKMSLDDKDVIVIQTAGLATPAHRRLGAVAESEAGMSTSVEFAIIGYTSQTPTELLDTLTPFLGDKTGSGLEFLLQDKLFGTKYQGITVAVGSEPTIVASAQAASSGAEEGASTGDAGIAVALSLGAVAMLCITLVCAAAAVFVVVVVVKRKQRSTKMPLSTKTAKAMGERVCDIDEFVTTASVTGERTGPYDLSLVLDNNADGPDASDAMSLREIELAAITTTAQTAKALASFQNIAVDNPAHASTRASCSIGVADANLVHTEELLGSVRVLNVAATSGLATDLSVEANAEDKLSASSTEAAQEERAAGFAAALEGYAHDNVPRHIKAALEDFGHDAADSDISISLGSSEEEDIDLSMDEEEHIDLNLMSSGEESIDLDV